MFVSVSMTAASTLTSHLFTGPKDSDPSPDSDGEQAGRVRVDVQHTCGHKARQYYCSIKELLVKSHKPFRMDRFG